ncbi:MAG: DUF6941 family protein [Candidatus Limnocylindrales bacterium]|jgi:hypothetical protein
MPEIDYAFLADAAEAQPGRKFAVLGGGVSRLGGSSFPLRHPHLALVVGLRVAATELDTDHQVRFVLLRPDGRELTSGAAGIRANGPGDGRDSVLTFSIDLWNLDFEAAGEHTVRLLVDGQERKRLDLVVETRETAASGVHVPPFPPPAGQA